MNRPPRGRAILLLLDQWTGALRQRAERLVCRYRRQQLVIVPWIFRFRRRFDLEDIGWMNLAPILADRTFAESRVVRRHFLHFGDDLDAVMRIAAKRIESLEI